MTSDSPSLCRETLCLPPGWINVTCIRIALPEPVTIGRV
jgi:hypothetical protein